MENKTVLIVQARLTSIRFPNKILKKIGSQTLLEILLKRLKQSKLVDQIVLAIPSNKKNKIITKILKVDVPVFYGSENDVLDRYYKAAKKFKAKNIVRISGDCPFFNKAVCSIFRHYAVLRKEHELFTAYYNNPISWGEIEHH